MRYLGPPFYGNWKVNRDMDEEGNCIDEKVLLAKQFSDRNVRYWFLGMESYSRNCSLAPLVATSCSQTQMIVIHDQVAVQLFVMSHHTVSM